jgi:hypothetical protein
MAPRANWKGYLRLSLGLLSDSAVSSHIRAREDPVPSERRPGPRMPRASSAGWAAAKSSKPPKRRDYMPVFYDCEASPYW